MQIFKEISIKKIIIYSVVLIIALGGASIYIYKNYQLSKANNAPEDYVSPADKIMLAYKNTKQDQNNEQPIGQETINKKITDIKIIDMNKILIELDTSVFEDIKFQRLIDNNPKQARSINVGKRNIFEP